jgi:Tol biopolymer transport system component
MKRLVVIGMVAATLVVAGAQTRDEAERMLKAARNAELVDGNLNAAISQYDAVIARFGKSDRAATASALVGKAECLQKRGDAEARRIYEQVVRDYADQKEAAALARARLGGGGPTGQPAMRAVWTSPKTDTEESSVSPDGRFITFPDWDTGNLGLHDLVTGADRLLTSTGSMKRGEVAFAEVSAFSRDGRQVAYAWYDEKLGHYELRVLGVNGDPKPRRVFQSPNVHYVEPYAWSPDGKWIAAYLWDKTNKVNQVGLIGALDGSLRLLKSGTADLRPGGFSSDGRYLVCSSGRPAGRRDINPRVYIISVDGKSEAPLLTGTSSAEYPVWTPDGSRIGFVSDRGGFPGLWSIRVADGRPVGEPELLSTSNLGNARVMSIASDGSLFYGVSLNLTDIYVAGLDPATGRLTAEPRRVNEIAVGNSWGRVAWLPNGKSLSFWTRAPGAALVVQALATSEVRELWRQRSGPTAGPGYAGWFEDGISLMSVDRQPDGQPWVFRRVDSRTGDVQATWTVAGLPPGVDHSFSPDLMTMFFVRPDENIPGCASCTYVLVARDLRTGQDREVVRQSTNGLRGVGGTSISPDGRDVAFIALDTLGASIVSVPSAGGPSREVYRGTNDDRVSSVAWTRDGSHLLALVVPASMPGGELWSFPATGGPPEKSPLRVRPSEKPAVSPDGRQIAFVGGSSKAEVWVMTGLFRDAKTAPVR